MTFHKPTCVKCSFDMFPDRNSVYVIDMFLDPPRPYRIWACDRWACGICGAKIMTGFSRDGVRHDEDGFKQLLKMALKQGEYTFCYENKAHSKANDSKLILGMTALIFQKPISGEELEGRAMLAGQIDAYKPGTTIQRWMVRFPEERYGVERVINTENAELEFKYT